MVRRMLFIALLALAAMSLLAACSDAQTAAPASPELPVATPEEIYRYNQLLVRDAIRPVYDPIFIAADQADLADDQLVLGVAIDGQAKAYPIAVLNGREMVNDELAGIPILATW